MTSLGGPRSIQKRNWTKFEKAIGFCRLSNLSKEANLKQQKETDKLKNVSVKTESSVAQPKKKTHTKVRVPYRSYSSEQVQEILDLVIKHGLSARKAGFIIGIVERTAKHYIKQYKDDKEKRLPDKKKASSKDRKTQAMPYWVSSFFFWEKPWSNALASERCTTWYLSSDGIYQSAKRS